MDPFKECKYILIHFLNHFGGGDYAPPWYQCWHNRDDNPDALGTFYIAVRQLFFDRHPGTVLIVTGSFTRSQYDEGANREIIERLAWAMRELVELHMHEKPGFKTEVMVSGNPVTVKVDLHPEG